MQVIASFSLLGSNYQMRLKKLRASWEESLMGQQGVVAAEWSGLSPQ